MSYTYDRDKMPTIHPDLGKFDFVVAKDKREWAQCKGIGSKEWIEFANLMFEQLPFIYNTCLLMNDEQKYQQATIERLTEQLKDMVETYQYEASSENPTLLAAKALIAEIEAGND